MTEVAPGRTLRAAVVGLGFIGPFHVDAVRRGGYGDVVTLVGTDQARTEARARGLGIARATTDLAAVLADEQIDVVHVCTPNASHVPIANAVLDAGKHLVLEKPIATDLASASALARKAADQTPPRDGGADLPRLPDGRPGAGARRPG